jgi:hypothetical protein
VSLNHIEFLTRWPPGREQRTSCQSTVSRDHHHSPSTGAKAIPEVHLPLGFQRFDNNNSHIVICTYRNTN